MRSKKVENIVLSALFLAIGFLLPMLTSQIKEIGDTLLPMHIPVLLCGLICSEKWGFLVGLILPFMRSFVFSMPPIYPNAIYMAAELATYGFIVGFLYSRLRKKNTTSVYISLIGAMISGRIVWGVATTLLLSLQGIASLWLSIKSSQVPTNAVDCELAFGACGAYQLFRCHLINHADGRQIGRYTECARYQAI